MQQYADIYSLPRHSTCIGFLHVELRGSE